MGQKRTFGKVQLMSALPPKADIAITTVVMSALCQKRTSQVCAVNRFLFSDRLRRREAAGGPIFFDTLPQKGAQKNRSCVRYSAELLLVKLELCRRDGYGSLSLPEHRLSCSRLPSRRGSVDHDGHVPVTCLACKFVHLVNPKTGEVRSSPKHDTPQNSS